eukprot:12705402-Alexandrium_andersonii.AAC.1
MAEAAPESTASTSARGPTRARPWAWRPSPRDTAFGRPRLAATCWASPHRLAASWAAEKQLEPIGE